MADAAAALLRALTLRAAAPIEIVAERTADWSSLTFAGTRHRLVIRLAAAAAGRVARAIATEAIDPVGHLLADISVARHAEGVDEVLEIQALTVVAG